MPRPKEPLTLLALAIFAILAIAPIAVMFAESFGYPNAFNFSAYGKILATPTERLQLFHSVVLGILAVGISILLGAGTAFLTNRSDLPLGRSLGVASLLPLLFPPIIVAMAAADLTTEKGLPMVALLLAVSHAPFTAALTARGLRSIDGRLYESVLLARGPLRAELFLLRQVLPDILAGSLLVLVFVLSNHGVPEFFSVKDKQWYTYSEAIFLRWGTRGAGPGLGPVTSLSPEEAAAANSGEAIAASLPLLVLTVIVLFFCLKARRRGSLVTMASDFRPLPLRRLGNWKWPAFLFCLLLPGLGVVMPAWRMLLWSAGSTMEAGPTLATIPQSFHEAWARTSDDLMTTTWVSVAVALTVLALAMPLAWASVRSKRPWIEGFCLLPLAVPATLLGIGFVRLWNRPGLPIGDLYDTKLMLILAYGTRFLPLGVLALANAVRRLPLSFTEAARLTRNGPVRRFTRVLLPLLTPSLVSAAVLTYILSLRELDLSVILLQGNEMVARRLSNIVHFSDENIGGALALLLLLAATIPLLLRILLTGRAGTATD